MLLEIIYLKNLIILSNYYYDSSIKFLNLLYDYYQNFLHLNNLVTSINFNRNPHLDIILTLLLSSFTFDRIALAIELRYHSTRQYHF